MCTEPLIVSTEYRLSGNFRQLAEQNGCKIKNVIELINCKVLQFWIECPKEIENEITDMAFMTWIKNPVFQKYYHGTPEFEKIAADYIKEQESKWA